MDRYELSAYQTKTREQNHAYISSKSYDNTNNEPWAYSQKHANLYRCYHNSPFLVEYNNWNVVQGYMENLLKFRSSKMSTEQELDFF